MDVDKILKGVKSMLTAGRVYGAPVEQDGVIVIPAAKITGGGGGNEADVKGQNGGGGGGFGVIAKPAGALIIEPGGKVRWKGFFDLNRMILGVQIVGIAFFLFLWLTERSKARAATKATIAPAAIDRVGRPGSKRRPGGK